MYDLDKRNRLRDLGFTPFVATREHLASKQKLNELFGMVARAIASHRYGLDESRRWFFASVGGWV